MKRKVKFLVLLSIAVCLAFSFLTACGNKEYAVKLNKETATLYVGEETTLTAAVTQGDEAVQLPLQWTSSDESVATVSEGKVVAHKIGTTTITATVQKASATCVVTVTQPSFTISLNESEKDLFIGESITLTAAASDGNIYDYSWSSSDDAVAKVENGVVTALSEGIATINAECYGMTATCKITVSEEDVFLIISNDNAEIKVGETLTLSAMLTDGSTPELVWSSSDEEVAIVSDGVVTALKAGTSVITVSAGEDLTDTCTITVSDVYTLIFPEMPAYIFVGEETDLNLVVQKNGESGNIEDAVITGENFTVEAGKIVATKSGEIIVNVSYFGQNRSQTVSAYYPVADQDDLNAINSDLSGWYMLTGDIDFNGGNVETIAHYSSGNTSKTSGFLGIFDGNGHSIMNFTAVYKGSIAANSSLFGWIGETGIVRNLNVFNASIKNRIAGGLANTNYGLIDNCFVEVTVNYNSSSTEMNNPIGGICSKNYGDISNSIAVLSLGAEVTDSTCMGGFVGRHLSGSSMTNCYSLSPLGFTEVAEPTNGAMAGVLTACESYNTLEDLYENIDQTAFSELWNFDASAFPHLGAFQENVTVLNTTFDAYAGTDYFIETESTLPIHYTLTENIEGVVLDGQKLIIGEEVIAGSEIKVKIYSLYDAAASKEITITVLENNIEVTAEKNEVEFTLIEGEEGEWTQNLGIVVKINGTVAEDGYEIRSSNTQVATVSDDIVTCVSDGMANIEVVVNGNVMLTVKVVCNVYKPIRTEEDFEAIRAAQDAKYILMNDIDFGGKTFSAFSCWATAVSTSTSSQFTGIFDGNGYSLLNINPGQEAGTTSNDWSIFGVVGKTGVIRNLSVIGAKINNRAGVITSYLYGTIENCYVEVTVCSTANTNAKNPVGGIVEKSVAGSLVKNCIAVVKMADGVSQTNVGGIVGQCVGSMENCQVINMNSTLGVHDGTTSSVGTISQSESFVGLNAFYNAETGADISAYGSIWVFTEGYFPHLNKMSDELSINLGENVYQSTEITVEVNSVFGATVSLKEEVEGVTFSESVLKVSLNATPETKITFVIESLYLPAARVEKTVTIKENDFSIDIEVSEYEFTWISGSDAEGNPYAVAEDYSVTPEFTIYSGESVYEGAYDLSSSEEDIIKIEDGKIVAIGDGTAEVSVSVGENVLGKITVISNMYVPVRTTEEFLAIGTDVSTMSKKYLLMNDLDFEGAAVYAFSSYKTKAAITFTGIFDGNGYTIKNLEPRANTSVSGDTDRAVFGYMDKGAIVRNVSFTGVKAVDRAAVVANWCENGLIENVYIQAVYDNAGVKLNASSSNPAGLVAAKLRTNGTVRNCIVDFTIQEGSYNEFIGGIVGQNNGKIENCALIYVAREGETVNAVCNGAGSSNAVVYESTESFLAGDLSSFDVDIWYFNVQDKTISMKKNCFKK